MGQDTENKIKAIRQEQVEASSEIKGLIVKEVSGLKDLIIGLHRAKQSGDGQQ